MQYATSLTYDALNRPLTVSWPNVPSQAAPTASSATLTHRYDATNRRVEEDATDKSRLLYPAGASSFSYTANALSQYSAVGTVTPTYDGNGNLTLGSSPRAGSMTGASPIATTPRAAWRP